MGAPNLSNAQLHKLNLSRSSWKKLKRNSRNYSFSGSSRAATKCKWDTGGNFFLFFNFNRDVSFNWFGRICYSSCPSWSGCMGLIISPTAHARQTDKWIRKGEGKRGGQFSPSPAKLSEHFGPDQIILSISATFSCIYFVHALLN